FKPTLLEKQRHSGDILTPSVLRLISQGLADGHDVVMLCRCNSIPWYVSYKDQAGGNGRGLDRYLDLIRSYFPKGLKERITISTAHKYKGLEKPMVIVLDAVARSYPLIHPDWIFSRILGDSPEKIAKEERRLLYVALTRAVAKLVVITDGRDKSPFIEELERSQPFQLINWADYPPVRGQTTRLIVKVDCQKRRGSTPTFAIKDLLKASGYQFQGKSTGWVGWAKSFPAAAFTVETIMSEIWADEANGIEVGVFDDTDQLVATFMVDAGRWTCVVDYLNTINTHQANQQPLTISNCSQCAS
ncbi:MAG: 3'-5' exonuclease, partial [Rhodoferax sp.]